MVRPWAVVALSAENHFTVDLPLPDGAVAQAGILVVAYFDTEGDTCYGFVTKGESSVSNILGVLELAKAHILKDDGP